MLRFLACIAASFLFVSQSTLAEETAKYVIVVSIDGGKPQTIEKTDLPTIHHLAESGAYSWKAETILPSITLPSHSSMISGVDVSVHGITWNNYNRWKSVIQVPTIFSIAKRNGLRTAIVASKEKFKHLKQPKSLDHFLLNYEGDQSVADDASKIIKEFRPNLMLVHFGDVDGTGHTYGWDTPPFIASLKRADLAVSQLVSAIREAGIEEETLLILTADHGGTGRGHGSADPEHRNIPWIVSGAKVKAGMLPNGISTMDTAATALWALGIEPPVEWEGKPIKEAFTD